MNKLNIEISLKEGAETCVIHFSSRGKKVGKYDRYPTPCNVSNIYINPSNRGWYVNGISSLGKTLEDSVNKLKELINTNNFSKVVCVGSSMGAFGAALFASRLNAECICFGPELYLGVFGGFSAQDKMHSCDFFNLFMPRKSLFVAGLGCPTDVLISNYYHNLWDNTVLILLPQSGHETARFLNLKDRLSSLIADFIDNKCINVDTNLALKKSDVLLKFSLLPPEKINYNIINEYYIDFKDEIISTQKLKLAEHLTNRNIHNIADNILVDFIEVHGPLSEAVFLLAKLRRRMKRNAEALSLFKKLELNPEYRLQGLWGQSMVHQKIDDFKEANRLYELIVKGAGNLAIVKESQKLLEKNTANQLLEAKVKNLVLTTFPAHKSNNVGDSMIANSALKLVDSRYKDFPSFTLFREESLDNFKDGTIENIIAPGFSVSNNVYPSLFKLYSDLTRLPNFFPIGCSFQHEIASQRAFDEYVYNPETIDFLNNIVEKSGPLHCRDQLIVNLMARHKIPAIYSGDLVLFDEQYINTDFSPIANVESVVFTIQHHPKYKEQSFRVLNLIRKQFPSAVLYVSFHSKESVYSRSIADFAINLGFKELHLYGEHTNLNVYDDIDLHIGYRLHGHISFLRRRKASILLVEDARSYGFSRTEGTALACINALDEESELPREDVCIDLKNLIDSLISNKFSDYFELFNFIDTTYEDIISPYFDKFSSQLKNNIN